MDRWGYGKDVVVRFHGTPMLLPIVKPPVTHKECYRCHEVKPLADFVGHKGKSDGRSSYCKPCATQRNAAWAQDNPAYIRSVKAAEKARNRIRHANGSVDVTEKRCSKCNTTKPAPYFHRNADTADGLARHCKQCRNQWVQDNPGRMREYAANRRGRVAAATVENVDRFVVYEREGGRCHICRRPVKRDAFHLEHLVPLSKGGDHSYANVAVAHPICNRRKWNHLMEVQLRLGV